MQETQAEPQTSMLRPLIRHRIAHERRAGLPSEVIAAGVRKILATVRDPGEGEESDAYFDQVIAEALAEPLDSPLTELQRLKPDAVCDWILEAANGERFWVRDEPWNDPETGPVVLAKCVEIWQYGRANCQNASVVAMSDLIALLMQQTHRISAEEAGWLFPLTSLPSGYCNPFAPEGWPTGPVVASRMERTVRTVLDLTGPIREAFDTILAPTGQSKADGAYDGRDTPGLLRELVLDGKISPDEWQIRYDLLSVGGD